MAWHWPGSPTSTSFNAPRAPQRLALPTSVLDWPHPLRTEAAAMELSDRAGVTVTVCRGADPGNPHACSDLGRLAWSRFLRRRP
eukprot:3424106-Rhodomonas_salina.1